MKKLLWVLLVIVGFMGCDTGSVPNMLDPISLEEAAQPYVDELGIPSFICLIYSSDNNDWTIYYWNSIGIWHMFTDSAWDDVIRWEWYSTGTYKPVIN